MFRLLKLPAIVCVAIILGRVSMGLSAKPPAPARFASVRIDGVPHIAQKPDFCGEACAAMYLQKLGIDADQDYVYDQSRLDPALGRGCYTKELARALQRIGFDTGAVWYTVPAKTTSPSLDEQFATLLRDLQGGYPSIICMRYDSSPQASEHFRLILGYDSQTDEVIYHEPAEKEGADRRMTRSLLLQLWPLKYASDQWSLIRMRLKLAKRPVIRKTEAFTDADYCQHILAVREKLPSESFHIVIQRPFVVIGDESAAVVRQRAEKTIKWAVEHLQRDFFEHDPAEILDIWLFKDEDSYYSNVKAIFNDRPTTPFGYYSPAHQALIMNISTGGGTLVHEIVHPFMATNFPGCPSWFNEGLASLYEQCAEVQGHIHGETNWRLQGLQTDIRKGRLSTFETLCGTTTRQFYDDPQGTHYGHARYLCYYLQEKGLLRKYYQEFRRNSQLDPTGYETLQQVLGERDMAAFQKNWEEYTLKLKF